MRERPIKFRAFDTRKKLMSGSFGISTAYIYTEPHWELMQFTGLLDKDGKEIWEGDILLDPQRTKDSQNVLVFWGDNCAAWMIHNSPRTWSEFIEGQVSRMTVLGNIHENPELLTEATQ